MKNELATEAKGWKTDIKDWTRVNKDLANFYLSQAETHLKSNIELSDRITARGISLLTILIPITALSTGYILNQTFLEYTNPYLLWISSASLLVLLLSLIALASLVGVRKWMPPGAQPKEILTSNMVDTELDLEMQYSAIVIGEVEAIQTKIDFTKHINEKRLKILNFVIWSIVLSFLVLAIFVFRQLCFYI